jgi:hypothetical protein
MTFAAGCDSKESAPPAAPTVDVGTGTSAPAAATTTATPATTTATPATTTATPATATAIAAPTNAPATLPTVAPTASVATKLPPAPSSGHVVRQSDGTCTWHADVMCPRGPTGRPIPCNPPRPYEVECPPDAGKP